MQIKAIDYKGKHFILQDEDSIDKDHDYVLQYIDTLYIINNPEELKNHVLQCNYYGIPSYLGSNKELNEKIENLEKEIKEYEQN